MTNELTAARLREFLHYDPASGVFRWIKTRNHEKIGSIAGWPNNDGYLFVTLLRVPRGLSRLAWLYVHGKWPDGQIDHRNRIKTDNSIQNLRDVPQSVNMQNLFQANRQNQTGLRGVTPVGRCGFQARIQANGVTMSLGYFKTPELAHQAYLRGKRLHHAPAT